MRTLVLALALVMSLATLASGEERIDEGLFSGGHTYATDGVATLSGTLGEPVTGTFSGSSLYVWLGFWRPSPGLTTSVSTEVAPKRTMFVGRAAPSPASGRTTLEIDLPVAARVVVRIFDISGRLVQQLQDRQFPAGSSRLNLELRGASGKIVPSGIYFLRLESRGAQANRKIVVLR